MSSFVSGPQKLISVMCSSLGEEWFSGAKANLCDYRTEESDTPPPTVLTAHSALGWVDPHGSSPTHPWWNPDRLTLVQPGARCRAGQSWNANSWWRPTILISCASWLWLQTDEKQGRKVFHLVNRLVHLKLTLIVTSKVPPPANTKAVAKWLVAKIKLSCWVSFSFFFSLIRIQETRTYHYIYLIFYPFTLAKGGELKCWLKII